MSPLFSICIPAYNCVDYISECVESVLNQSYDGGFEIVAVDDGSTDGTGDVLDMLSSTHPVIRVLHKDNAGLVAARIDAMSLACGSYIVSLDGDDVLDSRALELIAEASYEGSADIVFFGHYEFGIGRRIDRPINGVSEMVRNDDREGILDLFLNSKQLNSACFKAIRKDLFDLAWLRRYVETRMGEDWFISFVPMTNAKTLSCVNEPLYGYRIHTDSMTGSFDCNYPRTVLQMYECKMKAMKRLDGLDVSLNRCRACSLVELAKAVALIPAMPDSFRRYCKMLDQLRDDPRLFELLNESLDDVPPLFRIILSMVKRGRYRTLFLLKTTSSLLRKRRD